MSDTSRTKEELFQALSILCQRVGELQGEVDAHSELLVRAQQALDASRDVGHIFETVFDAVRTLLRVTGTSIWLLDAASGELLCHYATGPGSEIVAGWRLAPNAGFAGWVASHGQCLIVSDAWVDARYFRGVDEKTGIALHSILTVPLQGDDGVIGVLQVVDTEADRFGSEDLALLKPLASVAAGALARM